MGILIHDTDLEKFLKIFLEYNKSDIIELKNGETKEFTMKVNDIDVVVCAEYPHGAYWVVMKDSVIISLNNMEIPCFSLESDKHAHIKLGMLNKAKIIENFLTTH